MSAVTLAALACAASLLAAADRRASAPLCSRPGCATPAWRRHSCSRLVAFVGVVGSSALAASDRALAQGRVRGGGLAGEEGVELVALVAGPVARAGRHRGRAGDDTPRRADYRKAIAKDDTDWKLWYDLSTVTNGAESNRALAEAERLNRYAKSDFEGRRCLSADPLANPEPLIKRVYAYVAYRVGDGPDAEDLTSETFERALRYQKSYDATKGEPIAWLIGIARRCIDGRPPTLELSGEHMDTAGHGDLEEDAVRRLALSARRLAPWRPGTAS